MTACFQSLCSVLYLRNLYTNLALPFRTARENDMKGGEEINTAV